MQTTPKVPGYELLDRLGGGPLTQVFAARARSTDESCAVKVLRPHWQDQPTAIKFLQREARAGLAVQHAHLVRLRDTHVLRPPFFLVMELLPGESLRRRLRRRYRLDVATALWIVRQTAEALSALHRAGFVHGDVKPENIHLVDDGTAKLIDLGFAHRPGENAEFLRRGYFVGTADYVAPERCALDSQEDEKSDLFSLGVTLFEMLAGRLPYPSGSTALTLRRHRCDPPADIRKYTNSVPTGLIKMLDRLLAHEPAKRPDAAAVVQQLVALEITALGQRRASRFAA